MNPGCLNLDDVLLPLQLTAFWLALHLKSFLSLQSGVFFLGGYIVKNIFNKCILYISTFYTLIFYNILFLYGLLS